ncbi:hypothetical protein AKO1_005039 [Acrasis kona]|uniref:Uncharacterized protein n=1 Tax=Acrasis kona TaxID=1008807 RepID=A0AAW2Z6S6_9EUKA
MSSPTPATSNTGIKSVAPQLNPKHFRSFGTSRIAVNLRIIGAGFAIMGLYTWLCPPLRKRYFKAMGLIKDE